MGKPEESTRARETHNSPCLPFSQAVFCKEAIAEEYD